MAPSSKRTGYDPFKVKMVGSIPPGATWYVSYFLFSEHYFLALLKYKRDKRRLLYYDGTYFCECRFDSYIEHFAESINITLGYCINMIKLTVCLSDRVF